MQRGGPGLGTIQPSQADYFQTVKGGDTAITSSSPWHLTRCRRWPILWPWDSTSRFKYRNPAMILTDGVIGQRGESNPSPYRPRRSEVEIREQCPWATLGKPAHRAAIITSSNSIRQRWRKTTNDSKQYRLIEEQEVRYEAIRCEDANTCW